MNDSATSDTERAFGEAVGRLGPVTLTGVDALEKMMRRLHPPHLAAFAERLRPLHEAIVAEQPRFEPVVPPQGLESFKSDLAAAAELTASALSLLIDPGAEGVMGALRAMRAFARAQALLYPLRHALPPISAWFAEPFAQGELSSLEAREGSTTRVGLFRSGDGEARGGFDLYVPESYDGAEAWPLVVALHGGSGNGGDFLWTWLREARSRRFLLLSPTSRGSTWSLDAPETDGRALREMTAWVSAEWMVDREHVLLTGLSDGGTMTGLVGLGEDVPFTHLAPACGVLHPMNFAIGNLDRAQGKPIYLVHGALDWMFPVQIAREAARVLEDAGADLVYREIEDLSHTYPREENARIIEWMDPTRVAPPARESAGA